MSQAFEEAEEAASASPAAARATLSAFESAPMIAAVFAPAMALTAVALALADCAQSTWRHPSHNDAGRFNVDSMRCEQYAATTAPYRSSGYDLGMAVLLGERQAQYQAQYVDCMNRLGYYFSRQ